MRERNDCRYKHFEISPETIEQDLRQGLQFANNDRQAELRRIILYRPRLCFNNVSCGTSIHRAAISTDACENDGSIVREARLDVQIHRSRPNIMMWSPNITVWQWHQLLCDTVPLWLRLWVWREPEPALGLSLTASLSRGVAWPWQYSGSLAHPRGMYYNGKEGRKEWALALALTNIWTIDPSIP